MLENLLAMQVSFYFPSSVSTAQLRLSASVQNEDLSTALSAYEITAHSACVVTVDLFCRVVCSIEIPVVLSVGG
jgi:hypothetical protein